MINEKKLDLVPSQTAKYLGMTIDTEAGKVFPSLVRVEKFLERFCAMDAPPAQLWQVILLSPGFTRAAGSSRSPSNAHFPVASEGALVPRVRPSLSSGAFATGSETGPVLVDGEGPSFDGGLIRDTCTGF